jgi:hypothetical protein
MTTEQVARAGQVCSRRIDFPIAQLAGSRRSSAHVVEMTTVTAKIIRSFARNRLEPKSGRLNRIQEFSAGKSQDSIRTNQLKATNPDTNPTQ